MISEEEHDRSSQDSTAPAAAGVPRLFTAKAIGIGAFIGGPLAATVLIARNFSALGFKGRRNRTYLLGLGITLSYFWLLFEIPPSIADKIPNAVYGAIVAFLAYTLTENLQGKILRDHFANLGEKASGWAVAGWSILCAILTFGLAFLYIPMLPAFDFEGEVYAEGLLGNEIYYNENVESETLEQLGRYLIEAAYFEAEYPTAIELKGHDSGYDLTFSCRKDLWTDSATVDAFRGFGSEIERDVLKKPVSIILVDEGFKGVERKRL